MYFLIDLFVCLCLVVDLAFLFVALFYLFYNIYLSHKEHSIAYNNDLLQLEDELLCNLRNCSDLIDKYENEKIINENLRNRLLKLENKNSELIDLNNKLKLELKNQPFKKEEK